MALQDRDKLTSKSTRKIVKVTCNGAEYTLTAPFQVTFTTKNTGARSVCYAGFGGSTGQLSVKSNNAPTNTKSGRGRILTRRTQYAIKITPGERRGLSRFLPWLFSRPITREWILFEDEGELERSGVSQTIRQGEKLVTGDGPPEKRPVTTEDIKRTAEPYAKVDVSQARDLPEAQRDAEVPKLLALHAAVLEDPKNVQKQEELKAEQERIGVPETVPTPNPTPTQTPNPTPTQTTSPTPGQTPGQPPRPTPVESPSSTPGLTGPEPGPTVPTPAPTESTPGSVDRNPPLDAEQARLIGLIAQGKYKEAIAGLERRVRGPRATSLDAYELAVAYEQLLKQEVASQSTTHTRHRLQTRRPSKVVRKTPQKRKPQRRAYATVPRRKRPAFYAKKALKLNETDRRLSPKELDDSRRIASGK